MHTLAQMEVEIRGAFVFLFEVARLLGLEECGQATDDQKQLLRILTPLLKLFTGKQVAVLFSVFPACCHQFVKHIPQNLNSQFEAKMAIFL
jgi:hypothetical protein